MKFSFTVTAALGMSIFVLSGCASDRALIATKTNVGLDFDTKPPTAEISIARRELAIQPTFPNIDKEETALPILASFNLHGSFLNPSIIGHFSGGDAAVYLAKDHNVDSPVDSSLCLTSENEPVDPRGGLLKLWHKLISVDYEEYKNTPRPFYFATDTTFGVKAAWSGTTGPYPDSLKLGYNRKEFASPPIFVNEGCNTEDKATKNVSVNNKTADTEAIKEKPVEKEATQDKPVKNKKDGKEWSVRLPSFYASISNGSALSTLRGSEVNNVQFFATGRAATELAKRKSVRQVAFESMVPEAAEIEAKPLNQALIQDIKKIFDADKTTQEQKNKILERAVKLRLVDKETTTNVFISKLNVHSKVVSYATSTKLNELRDIASKL